MTPVRSRLPLFLVVAFLSLLPSDGFAGRFGIFKRHRSSHQACCAKAKGFGYANQNVCCNVPCNKPTALDHWICHATGVMGNQTANWSSYTCNDSYKAIMDAYQNSPSGYSMVSFTVLPCEFDPLKPCRVSAAAPKGPPGRWRVTLTDEYANGKRPRVFPVVLDLERFFRRGVVRNNTVMISAINLN